ncbi:MAG: peptidoglycan-binding protein LysM [bacterium]|nr:peptidoglycan-binding protein LysM [bacterium]
MGLLSFVKSAGESIFGKSDEDKRKEAAMEAAARKQAEEVRRLKKAKALENHVAAMGLEIEDASFSVRGGTVTVRGKVATQEDSEKVALTVGNVADVDSVDNQLEVTNPEPEAVFYTVVAGDSLSKIAKQHYGNAMKYPAIFEANKPMLEHPDKIYPGQVLRIPPIEG